MKYEPFEIVITSLGIFLFTALFSLLLMLLAKHILSIQFKDELYSDCVTTAYTNRRDIENCNEIK